GETADSLINRDYKEFDINGKKFGIGQIELVDSSIADSRIPEIKSRLNEILVQKGYDDIVFAITDIMKEGSKVFVYGADADEIARIIGGALSDGGAWIDGLMSRKKQIVAPLNEKLSGVK
ncbi:MAG: hypothetical protein LBH41_00205, partial [Rickettsiales bacterium]|nr:hypothetical protein [Rickettsiales bacterium]